MLYLAELHSVTRVISRAALYRLLSQGRNSAACPQGSGRSVVDLASVIDGNTIVPVCSLDADETVPDVPCDCFDGTLQWIAPSSATR